MGEDWYTFAVELNWTRYDYGTPADLVLLVASMITGVWLVKKILIRVFEKPIQRQFLPRDGTSRRRQRWTPSPTSPPNLGSTAFSRVASTKSSLHFSLVYFGQAELEAI